ncbi:hypothetical protein [Pseudomonas sp. MWU16-30317]|uniref:hypothetical protein n=1 Tax=Pseudomonas sp. MWU16-30317 TaxID=2878095 RepID=UPI001CFA979E|nr:hypothetical protein [Pseudomonas sp. MWU16-30317]
MSRSAYEIAYTGLEDLYQVQDAFIEFHALFTVMLNRFPQDSETHAMARLGIASVDAWADTVCQWSECMDNELDELETEGEAYRAKVQRMCVLRAAHFMKDEK